MNEGIEKNWRLYYSDDVSLKWILKLMMVKPSKMIYRWIIFEYVGTKAYSLAVRSEKK